MNFSPFESPISQLGLQLPGRSALPHGESLAAQRRPVPGQGGVRSSPPAPTLTFPLRSPRPAPPPTLSPPPQALQSPGCRWKEGAEKPEGWSQGVSPRAPCHPALRRGRRAHGTPQQTPAADAVAAAAAVATAGQAAVAAQPSGPGGEEQPPRLRAATRRKLLPLPGSLTSTPGPPRGREQKQARKRGSPAVRAALASAPAPGSSAPISPCQERQDQLRAQRTSFLLETRTGFGHWACPVPLHESRSESGAGEIPLLRALAAAARRGWRGPTGRGRIPRKAGPGAGAWKEGAGRAPRATPAGRGFGASWTRAPLIIWEDGREECGPECRDPRRCIPVW